MELNGYTRLIYTDLPITEIVMKCTRIKTKHEFSYIIIIYCQMDVIIRWFKTLGSQVTEKL